MPSTLRDQRFTDDTLPMRLAILDANGNVVSTNRAWDDFEHLNGCRSPRFYGAADYIEACRGSTNQYAKEAPLVADGIETVLSGAANDFRLTYPFHSPSVERWFTCLVAPLPDTGGVIVLHVDVTDWMSQIDLKNAVESGTPVADSRQSTVRAWRELSVLVVDDEPAVLDATGALLAAKGFSVTTAGGADTAAAVAGTANRSFDLLIVDHGLADARSGGDSVARLRKAAGHDLPAIVYSGTPDAAERSVGGMEAVVVCSKSSGADALLAAIDGLVENRIPTPTG